MWMKKILSEDIYLYNQSLLQKALPIRSVMKSINSKPQDSIENPTATSPKTLQRPNSNKLQDPQKKSSRFK